MTAEYFCKICDSDALEEIGAFSRLCRVTSDSKPWPAGGQLVCCTNCGAVQKLPSAKWMSEISDIYDNFELYHQAAGAEQPIFDASGRSGEPRSARIVDHITTALSLGASGTLLDFGCGNGDALASFAKRHSGWTLFGAELSDGALHFLQQIPNFEALYTCGPEEIDREFNLVVMIHSLEHMVDPITILADLRSSVGPGGHILVEVPDCGTTPYDLLVADHLLHFSLDVLGRAGEIAGFETVALSNSVLPKELTWIGRPAAPHNVYRRNVPVTAGLEARDKTRQQVNWLMEQVDLAHAKAEQPGPFGIFGTSISATWLQSALGGMAEFFVDEDPLRVHNHHMGRPIVAPAGAPEGANVYIPLIPGIARSVAERLNGGPVNYHVPPLLQTAAV